MAPNDFIHPSGELQLGLFPDMEESEIYTMLGVWIKQEEGSSDEIVTAWVYHRAYDTVAQRLANSPSAETYQGGGGNTTLQWGSDRITHFRKLSEQRKATYDALVAGEEEKFVNEPATSSVVMVQRTW